jgi:hypothetical protein
LIKDDNAERGVLDSSDLLRLAKTKRAELTRLRRENSRLKVERDIGRFKGSPQGRDLLRRGTRPPQPLITAVIDALVVEGFAVESICSVLTSDGCQVAANTHRSWKHEGRQVTNQALFDAVNGTMTRPLDGPKPPAGAGGFGS